MKHKENHYTRFLWPSNVLNHHEKTEKDQIIFSEKTAIFLISPLCSARNNVAAARNIADFSKLAGGGDFPPGLYAYAMAAIIFQVRTVDLVLDFIFVQNTEHF